MLARPPSPCVGEAEVDVAVALLDALDLAADPDAVTKAPTQHLVDGVGQLVDGEGGIGPVVEFEVQGGLAHRRHDARRTAGPGNAASIAGAAAVGPVMAPPLRRAPEAPRRTTPRRRRGGTARRRRCRGRCAATTAGPGAARGRRLRVPARSSYAFCTESMRRPTVVEGAGELVPLLLERAEHGEDLLGRLLDHEVVERLADHAEHGEQRERRAEHDLLAEGVVDQRGIVLVDEAAQRLVRQEQEHVVDRGAGALMGVLAPGQLPHPQAHVAQEGLAVRRPLGFGAGVEVAQVGGERELHVHVQDVALRQRERVVGQGARARDGGLLLVVHVLDEARQPQHVLGHALPPLAPRLRAGQGLAEALRGGGQRRGRLGVGRQRRLDAADGRGVVACPAG